MKSKIITLAMILIVATFVLSSCGKSDKDKLISLYENYTKFVESDEHFNMLSDQNSYNEKMQAKIKDLFDKSGFKDEQEVTKVDESLKDDKDVIAARQKFSEASQKVYTKFLQEHPEIMKQMQGDTTNSNPAEQPVDTTKK